MFKQSTFQDPKRKILIVAMVVGVLYAWQVYRLGWPSLNDLLFGIIVSIFFSGVPMLTERVSENLIAVYTDFWLLVIAFFAFLAFFAQFVLPLHRTRERFWAFSRLVIYILGLHGPAVFIEDGEIVQRKREKDKLGWGVVVLDTASAAVLRTALAFTRTVGPGTVFTSRFEKVAGAVDLHRQSQFIGPPSGESGKNLFALRSDGELDDEYRERQERRWATSALTRDGVEIVPNVFILFQLDDDPDDKKKQNTGDGTNDQESEEKCATQFVCHLGSVRKAIIHESIDPEKERGSDQRHVSWNKLPAYLAADVWREYLRRFTFDELFAFTSTNPSARDRQTAFEVISSAVRARMTQEKIDKLDEFGHPTGVQVESREYKILKDRGIKVIVALILNLRFPEAVDGKLEEQWRANWHERAKEEKRFIQQQRAYAKHRGYEMALKNFADASSRLLGHHLRSGQGSPDLSQSLEFLVRGTLDQCIRDPELHQHLTNEKADIAGLIEWIRSNN